MAIHNNELEISRPPFLTSDEVDKWILKDLNHVTVILGKNGSGKSLLLRKLLEKDNSIYHYSSPERAGQIAYDPGQASSETSGQTRAGKRTTNQSPTFRNEVISRIQTYMTLRGSKNTRNIGQKPKDIQEIINGLFPDFNLQLTKEAPFFKLTKVLRNEDVSDVNQLSSGEAEVLTLILDILLISAMWNLDKIKKGTLLIDEPDTHLHPDLQMNVAKALVEIQERYQVQMIIATHSTTLLAALGHYGGEKTSVIYLNSAQVSQNATKFDEHLKELSTVLGGHALMAPLFNIPLLLVEGDDDYKIWSQVSRHSTLKISVIPCGGDNIDKYQKRLNEIFESLKGGSNPVGYVIKDSDKSCPSIPKLIKCMKLVCLESENLYLTDEVLDAMSLDWDSAKKRIKKASNRRGQNKSFLKSVDSWDRKTKDLKNHMEEIADALDDKKLPWTMRIGKTIGKNKPSGQLEEFLGSDIVKAFWL